MTEIATLQTVGQSDPRRVVPGRSTVRRRLVVAGTVAATVIGASTVAVVVGGPGGHGQTAFAVEPLATGTVAIRVVNSDVSAQDMTRQLHARGIAITVSTEPAAPQLVGRWVGLGASAGVPADVVNEIGAHMGGSVATLDVPVSIPGELHLIVGRTPKPGEAIAATGEVNAASPGGLLYCYQLSNALPLVAAARLRAAGYSVHWLSGAWGQTPAEQAQVATSSSPPPGVVVEAITQDPAMPTATASEVFLRVDEPSDVRYSHWLWTGYPASAVSSGDRDYRACPVA